MALACASVNAPSANPGTGGSSAGTAGTTGVGGFNVGGFGGSAQTGTCVNLQCKQDNCTRGACTQPPCPNGGKTTVSGIVYDPAGKTPLYNVVVYVPNEPLADIPTGASCDTCSSPYSGRPITATLTDSQRALLARAHAGGRQHPAGHPDREVAARGHRPVGGGVRRHIRRRGADAPAAQQERGTHPEDRDRERRLGRAQLPAQEDRRRRGRVHVRVRRRPRESIRGAQRARRPTPTARRSRGRRRCGAAPPR